jgi:hypothetical protein
MTWNAWMGVLHWAAFGMACAVGAFGLLTLNTKLLHARWQRQRGGIRAGQLIAKAGIALFEFPPWLVLALIPLQLVCLGGYIWLWLMAQRIRSENAPR